MATVSDRYYFMDTLRGTLMSLGIVLHSAQVYNPERGWLIHAGVASPLAGLIVDAIHVFRMPAFFLVSGFFCALTLQRYPPQKFLRVRMQRILLPLITAALLLNPMQALLLNAAGWRTYTVDTYLASDESIAHLWFLINLAIYFLVALALRITFRRQATMVANAFEALVRRVSMYSVLLMLPLLEIAVRGLNKIGFPLYSQILGVISVENLIVYLPFFAIGALMYARKDMLRRFSRVHPFYSMTLIALAAPSIRLMVPIESLGEKILAEYLMALQVWASVSLCLFVFYNFLNVESKLAYVVSDASYTVYLFHHILVVLFGLLLADVALLPLPGLLTLITLVSVTSYAIHLLVVAKVPVARLLFNGK